MVMGTSVQPQSASVITSTTTMQPTVIQTPTSVESAVPQRRPNDNRRSNKPIMEKRRRARINNCLNDLKTLILEAMKKDPARHSKLEKADILEMTVKHLENLQRQQAAISAAADPSALNKFRAGFSECAAEVGRFPGLESTVKRRLLQHLANCLGPNQQTPTKDQPPQPQKTVQLHILPQQQEPIFLTNQGVQLVQTRLPNGDIALILPTQNQQSTVPLLIPIPQQRNFVVTDRSPQQDRPSSSTSTFSNNSGYSSPGSPYEPVTSSRPSPVSRPTPYQRPDRPLSLVIRKAAAAEPQVDEKPWRPW